VIDMSRAAPHQGAALERMMDEQSLLIEYGTGTGKTLVIAMAVHTLVINGEVPIVVVVPNSLMEQTQDEFEAWTSKEWVENHVSFLTGATSIAKRADTIRTTDASVLVLSHESLSFGPIQSALSKRQWAAAFVDELSRFRNYSKRTRALLTLGTHAESRYGFSGNLAVRNPADVFYPMRFIEPQLFGTGNRQTFTTEYCLLGGYSGMQPIGIRPDKLKKLTDLLDSKRIKVELRDIREMPERILTKRYVTLSGQQRKAYIEMQEEMYMEVERETEDTFRSKAATYSVRLLRLMEIAAGFGRNRDGDTVALPSPKTDELLELLDDEPDAPTVVWYWWRPEGERLELELQKHGTPASVLGRPGAVEDFMSGRTNVFLSQLARGGYGLNLTRASRMIYHSLPWDLDVYTQSQERNMRLTTQHPFLEVVHLLGRKTVDEYVRDRLVDKATMSSQLSRSQALELLKRKPE
jgi:SNF2 family DNA or RNA helicase